jgi:hypothetical protein
MLQRMEYFDVYFLCQIASNLLEGGFERTVNDFFEPFSESYREKNAFMKYSRLHDYCEWVIQQNIWDDGEDVVHSVREAYRTREYTWDKGAYG